MKGLFVFIESNTTGTGRLMTAAAVRRGYRPMMLAQDPSRYPYLQSDGVEVHSVDTRDLAAVLESCRALDPIVGVTSSSDYFIGQAARVAQALDRTGPSAQAIAVCTDKQAQRAALHDARVPCPAYGPAHSIEEASALARAVGWPVVLKPRAGSGSVGVRLCRNEHEVKRHAEALLCVRANERGIPIPPGILVEAFVEGPEYSVEVFSTVVVGVTRKHLGPLPHFVEVGHDFPAAEAEDRVARIAAAARSAVVAVGLTRGPAHVELRDTDRGPLLIEVNPRLAGGFIPELVRLARGVDLVDASVAFAAGQPVDLESRKRDFASVRFLLPARKGTLRAVTGLEWASAQPLIADVRMYRAVGDALALGGDFRDRAGHVVACGPNPASVRAAADDALASVKLVLDDEAAPAEQTCHG